MKPSHRKCLPEWSKRIARRILPADTLSLLRQPELRTIAAMLPDGAEPLSYYCVGARGDLPDGLVYLRRQGTFRFIGFEPETVEARRLSESNEWDEMVCGALGGRDAVANMYVTENPGCSSFYEPHMENVQRLFDRPQWFRVVSQQSIKVNRLATLVVQQKLPPPEILQIDVQGYELEVLKGAEELLSQVLVINLETHLYPLYRDQPLFPQIHAYLTEMGFMLMSLRKANRGFGGRFVEADACYISDRHSPENIRLRTAFAYYKWTNEAYPPSDDVRAASFV